MIVKDANVITESLVYGVDVMVWGQDKLLAIGVVTHCYHDGIRVRNRPGWDFGGKEARYQYADGIQVTKALTNKENKQ